jgi:hypothetical protein
MHFYLHFFLHFNNTFSISGRLVTILNGCAIWYRIHSRQICMGDATVFLLL